MNPQQKWQALLNTDRCFWDGEKIYTKPSKPKHELTRSPFHTDYDRVVFSSSFRKLGRKTQVHPFAKSDHTHNRLTHSVEVASVGRSLGFGVGNVLFSQNLLPSHISPSDIGTLVQVACLAHDLGNPPFGHTGEDALREWFLDKAHFLHGLTADEKSDICTYEGNAHSLRTVCRTEIYRNQGGMRLTAASLGTLLKYPWGSKRGNGKFNIYQSEMPLMRTLADKLGLIQKDDDCWARHPLSYLMEAADDICYALLDLEDAVELELLGQAQFFEVVEPLLHNELGYYHAIKNPKQRLSAMRGKAISLAIEEVAAKFFVFHDALLNGQFAHKDLLSACDDRIKETLENAKELAKNQIFSHHSKLTTEIASFGCLGGILDVFIPAVYAKIQGQPLTTKNQLALQLIPDVPLDSSLYEGYMGVLDFVGGLTDNSAGQLAKELSGVGLG